MAMAGTTLKYPAINRPTRSLGEQECAVETVLDRIEGSAGGSPDRVAVRGQHTWTYSALMARVEHVSALLRPVAGPGLIVAVEVVHAEQAIVATLACFRLDMVVMPLDPHMPEARTSLMVENARPAARLVEDLASGELTAHLEFEPGAAAPVGSAYVMYTSGSTGVPKGVIVSHRALIERLDGLALTPGLSAGETMLALTAFTFDIAMAELLLPLVVGGTVICADPAARSDPSRLESVGAKVDVIQATPSYWRLCLAERWRGAPNARLWCGGEALTPALAEALLPRCGQLWNVYGPTEATIWATAARVTQPTPIDLGTPLPGSAVTLIDSDGRVLIEPGQVGELVLSGAGIATGYLGREELTAARFGPIEGVPSPSYRTGDLARYREDGSLEFQGRVDGQVKLRGHRIEIGEVEALLEQHPAVTEAAVVLRNPGDPMKCHLKAYVAGHATDRELRRWLAERLPEVMVPQKVQVAHVLPRTTAGKIDRVALTES